MGSDLPADRTVYLPRAKVTSGRTKLHLDQDCESFHDEPRPQYAGDHPEREVCQYCDPDQDPRDIDRGEEIPCPIDECDDTFDPGWRIQHLVNNHPEVFGDDDGPEIRADGGQDDPLTEIGTWSEEGSFWRCDECGSTAETRDAVEHVEGCPAVVATDGGQDTPEFNGDRETFPNPFAAASLLPPGRRRLDAVRQFCEEEQDRLHQRLRMIENADGSIPDSAASEWSMVKGRLDQTRLFYGLTIQGVLTVKENETRSDGGPPPEGFDYGERLPDGQFENYPTVDDGEMEQEVRDTYVHADGCEMETTMSAKLAKSVARDPTFYTKTFCAGCKEHVPVSEVEWEDGEDWVVSDDLVTDGGTDQWQGPKCWDCGVRADRRDLATHPVHVDRDDEPGYDVLDVYLCRGCRKDRMPTHECQYCGREYLDLGRAAECCQHRADDRIRPDGGRQTPTPEDHARQLRGIRRRHDLPDGWFRRGLMGGEE